MIRAALILAALLAPVPAQAAAVTIDVRDADGRPVPGAVVLIDSPRVPAGPIRFPWPSVMAQQNISFQPHVLIVPVGASVAFPNKDKVRHHVYSFSKPKKFELKLYGRDDTRSVVFDKPGVIALGCNIHDQMSGFIWVVDTPLAAQSDASGHLVIAGVPPGTASLRLWHPTIRAPANILQQAITVGPGGFATTLTLR